RAVHQSVHHLLVDHVVGEVGQGPGAYADGVDGAVDHPLVGPVGGAGDGALDRAHDDVGVEDVEVVLVGDEAVEAAGDRRPLGGVVEGPEGVAEVVEERDRQTGQGHGDGKRGGGHRELVLGDARL